MKYKKILLLSVMVITLIAGCMPEKQTDNSKDTHQQEIYKESEKLAEGYRNVYENAVKNEDTDSLETKQNIIAYMGKEGYAAVDLENQIDMVNAEQVEKFCNQAKKKQNGEVTILSVLYDGGFSRYDMETNNGKINVEVSHLEWEDGNPKADHFREYEAHTWKYTDNGYFFIEEYHMDGYDGAPGQTGFRVKPLEKICRELNKKYVMPIGYANNNLLITEWNASDYTELDFYDLYETMYRIKNDSVVPYDAEYGGMEYEVPKTEFEEALQTYLQIDSAVIEENAVYNADSQTYHYRPRGLYDCGFAYGPYPEVVDYEELDDGNIKLTVNAVWIREMTDASISSELVVKLLENGQFQYVSNHIISSAENSDTAWYVERLNEEEWDEYYGENN